MCLYPSIDLKATGRNIARLRKERGLSVKQLQAYFGFEDPQAIYRRQWDVQLQYSCFFLYIPALQNSNHLLTF